MCPACRILAEGPRKRTNPKEEFGDNKIPLHLWPDTATLLGALALLHGALKYGRANWRPMGVKASTYYSAGRRHFAAWFEGEDLDPDSGLPHLAHVLACVAIVIDAGATGNLVDDRAYPGGYVRALAQLTPLVAKMKASAAGMPEPKHYSRADDAQMAQGRQVDAQMAQGRQVDAQMAQGRQVDAQMAQGEKKP
jgi:hypothetical protein